LGWHEEPRGGVELAITLDLHRTVDRPETVDGSTVEGSVHEHGLADARFDDGSGGRDLISDQVASAVHAIGPSELIAPEGPCHLDRLGRVHDHERAHAVDLGHGEPRVGQSAAAGIGGHGLGRAPRPP